MTVDVEDYFHVTAFSSSLDRSRWDSLESRVRYNTGRLLDVFSAHSIRATFFVLGLVAERYPSLVRKIADAGHEVGCHGYSHRLVFEQTREEFRSETNRAKAVLEQIVGARVRGYRAASFSVTQQSAWVLDEIVEAGFEYDSSIAPMHHDIYGWPTGPSVPGKITTPGGGSIVEFPVMLARYLGAKVPVAGGGYFRILPYPVVRAGLRRINAAGQPFFFYLHPWEIDPDQPRVRSGWKSRIRHYTGLAGCEAKLQRLAREFRFTTMEEVLADLLPKH